MVTNVINTEIQLFLLDFIIITDKQNVIMTQKY